MQSSTGKNSACRSTHFRRLEKMRIESKKSIHLTIELVNNRAID
jgi:hypothetical protein